VPRNIIKLIYTCLHMIFYNYNVLIYVSIVVYVVSYQKVLATNKH